MDCVEGDAEEMNDVTFGQTIKALRHGFCPCHCGFLRISGNGPFKIELLPFSDHHFPKLNGMHKQWWPEVAGDPKAINPREIAPIQNIVKLKRAVTFWVDDNGEFLR